MGTTSLATDSSLPNGCICICVLWDVSQTNAQKAFKDVQNGSILLYHTNPADYKCLQTLIPMLQEAGYELVTVSELLGLDPLVLDIPADIAEKMAQ